MSVFKVYQINFTNEQAKQINERDPAIQEDFNLYLNTIVFPKVEAIEAAAKLYKPACEIFAANLDHVYEIGNIGPENEIKRLGPMHSISVGDIIVDEKGDAHYVDSFGFGTVKFTPGVASDGQN
jgi:hypothetical protein